MQIACPSCQKQLKVPDTAVGKKVRCPNCNGVFQAVPEATEIVEAQAKQPRPSPPPPPPPEDRPRRRREEEEEVPSPPRKRREPDDDAEVGRERRGETRRQRDDEIEEERDRPGRRSRADEEEEEDYDDRPRRKRRDEEEDDYDDRAARRREEDEDDDDKASRREARRRGKSAALWFLIAAITTLVMLAINISSNLFVTARFGAFDASRVAGMLGCGVIVISGAILQIQASSSLKSFRGKGKVITGIVFGFIYAVLFGIGAVINLLGLALVPGGILKVMVLFTLILSAITLFVNLFAAIKGIVTLNNVDVSRAFRRRR
jgi:predicted Zn finger-like uncharacterized protein